jgi:diacylglycerol kinase (ATP)
MSKKTKNKKNINNFEVKNNATLDTNVVTAMVNSGIETTTDFFEPISKYLDVNFNTVRNNKNRMYKEQGISRYSIFKSFRYAGSGLYWAFVTEPNVRIQLTIGLFFFGLNLYFGQLILAVANLIFMAMTCSFEIINTIVENICDYIEKSYRPEIKIIKDMAAGAVLVVSLVWAVVILFGIIKIGLLLLGIKAIMGMSLIG